MRVLRWFGRLLLDSALLLPRTLRSVAGGRPRALLLVPLGVLALLVVLLSTLNEIRVLLIYPITDDVTPGTWGGPTMAGAWALHAALGLVLLPVLVAVMVGIRSLATRFDRGQDRRTVLAVVLADLATLAFLVAFVRQL